MGYVYDIYIVCMVSQVVNQDMDCSIYRGDSVGFSIAPFVIFYLCLDIVLPSIIEREREREKGRREIEDIVIDSK